MKLTEVPETAFSVKHKYIMNVKFILSSLFAATMLFTFGATTTECQAQIRLPFGNKHHQNNEDGENGNSKTGNLLDALKGVVDAVKPKNLVGTWSYTGTDMKIKGDDVLSRVGGQLASKELEESLDTQLQKGRHPARPLCPHIQRRRYLHR